MKPGLPPKDSRLSPPPSAAANLQLLVTLDPWYQGLLDNVRDLFSAPGRPAPLSSSSAPFWPDVFVGSRLPWQRLAASAMLHGVVILGLWVFARWGPQKLYREAPVVFPSADVIRYEWSEYLPTLDSGGRDSAPAAKGAPAQAAQAIMSVPPNSDNRRQTVVSPPRLELQQDAPLPNMVAWADPAPRIPAAATAAQVAELRVAGLPAPVVAPPPEVVRSRIDTPPVFSQAVVAPAPELGAAMRRNGAPTPQPAIVGPPPGIEVPSVRSWHDLNLSPAQVVSPAPGLPIDEQYALKVMARASLSNSAVTVVPPSPQEESTKISTEHGRLIALSVHPVAPPGPVAVPNGNRRGTFAAGPSGETNAAGTPDLPAGRAATTAASAWGGATDHRIPGVPPGLFVGPYSRTEPMSHPSGEVEADPNRGSGDPGFMAKSPAPRVVAAEISADQQSELERQVFGGRRSYGMTLNLPNLNSAGGSWVMHFSELEEGVKEGDLVAPVAMRAVAPGYPLELMRENVEGTVTLSAVIARDGQVGEVTVLSGSNDRLNEYARDALLAWRFLPALRNGKPVALQAVVRIPFRPRVKASF